MLIGTNYNFNGNQLLNAVIHQGTGAPSSPQEGMMYTNTTAHTLNAYLNGSWVALSTSASSVGGGGTANQAAYWSALNVVSGVTVASGIVAHDNTGAIAAVTSTTPGAILVASATRPLFSNVTVTPNTTGFAIAGGSTTAKTLTISNTLTLAGTDSSTLNIGTGGTLGTAAYTAATAYEPALGNPGTNGFVLSSTTTGTRSWVANGFQNPMTTLGDTIYGAAAGAATRLAGPTVNGTYVLGEVVSASTSVAPAWINVNTIVAASVTNALTINNGGSGAASGATFTGASAVTISYNTVGATANVFTTLGDLVYGNVAVATRLAGPTVAGTYVLTESPAGTAVAPVWTLLNTLSASKASNLVGASLGVLYQSATDTTTALANPGAANRYLMSGAAAVPAWSTSTLVIGGNFSTASTFTVTAGAVSIANGLSTTGTFSSGGNFSTSSTFAVTGALSIGAAFTTSSAFTTTGAFTTSLTQGANLTLTLPAVATANMVYNAANPGAANQLAYAAATTPALSYITAPAALSVLTQSSNAAAPAWTTATGTGSPVMGTNPTISITTAGGLSLNYTPTNATDAVMKSYVDNIAIGLNDWKQSVHAATTANVTVASAAPNTLDGVTLAANDRILVKNQTLPAENGIYTVTTLGTGANGVWTRATDADTSAEVTTGMYLYVEEGTATNKGQYVLNTPGPITLGTTGLTFVRFNGGSALTAGNGINITGDTISLNVAASTTYTQYAIPYFPTTTTIGAIALPTVNNQVMLGLTAGAPFFSKLVLTPPATNATITITDTKTFAVSNSLTLAGADGKTINFGANSFTLSTAKDAVTYTISGTATSSASQVIPTKYTTTITGAGPHAVTHNIGTKDVTVSVYDNADNLVVCDVVTTSTTVVTLTWGFGAPGASTFRVVVTG